MSISAFPHLLTAREVLPDGARRLGVELSDEQIGRFAAYSSLLIEANERVNLTAVVEPGAIMRRHVLDSLSALPFLDSRAAEAGGSMSVVDVGSGAGLPGLVLAVMRSDWTFTLVDSVAKRARFLTRAVRWLDLANVAVVASRAEEFGRLAGRDRFDGCVARAVAPTPVLLEYCAPLVRSGGTILLYKNGDPERETVMVAPAARQLGCGPPRVEPVMSGLGVGDDRFLLIVEKREPTPRWFPRRVGAARSSPLRGSPR